MPRCTKQWNIRQWLARLNTSQHQSAPAHVSSTDEFRREHQLLAEDCQQGFNIFRCSNATHKDDLTTLAADFRDTLCVTFEQLSVMGIFWVHVA